MHLRRAMRPFSHFVVRLRLQFARLWARPRRLALPGVTPHPRWLPTRLPQSHRGGPGRTCSPCPRRASTTRRLVACAAAARLPAKARARPRARAQSLSAPARVALRWSWARGARGPCGRRASRWRAAGPATGAWRAGSGAPATATARPARRGSSARRLVSARMRGVARARSGSAASRRRALRPSARPGRDRGRSGKRVGSSVRSAQGRRPRLAPGAAPPRARARLGVVGWR